MKNPQDSYTTGFSLIMNPGNIYGSLEWVQPAVPGAGGFASCNEKDGKIFVWAKTTVFLSQNRAECSSISLGIPLFLDGSTGVASGEVWQYT
jgi:hypothetical protein